MANSKILCAVRTTVIHFKDGSLSALISLAQVGRPRFSLTPFFRKLAQADQAGQEYVVVTNLEHKEFGSFGLGFLRTWALTDQ